MKDLLGGVGWRDRGARGTNEGSVGWSGLEG